MRSEGDTRVKGLKHDFDGLRAVGHYIIAEQVGVAGDMVGSIVVPEASRIVVWKVIAVGPDTKVVEVGQRVLFINQTGVSHEGRTFAFLRPDQVIAVLEMPAVDDAPRIQVADLGRVTLQ